MLYIQIKDDRDPRVLADLIASTQSEEPPTDPKLAIEAWLVREHQDAAERERPSRHTIDTVNFQKLDDENDWTDV